LKNDLCVVQTFVFEPILFIKKCFQIVSGPEASGHIERADRTTVFAL